MTVDAFGIHWGPVTLRYYALVIAAGVLTGAWIAAWDVKRRGQDPEFVWDLLVWAVLGGVVGARLWCILTPTPSMIDAGMTTCYYLRHPLEVLAVWKGGVSVIGAVPGGLAGVYLYCRRHGIDFVACTDSIAPSLAVGQAIGRTANYVNQELHGLPTSLPWGIYVDQPLPPYTAEQRFHPVFLYESLGTLFIGIALILIARRRADWWLKGDLFLLYLIAYPVLRFGLDCLKPDLPQVFGWNAVQPLTLLVAGASAVVLSSRHLRTRGPNQGGRDAPKQAK